jgi:E1A/CREB-binding protein
MCLQSDPDTVMERLHEIFEPMKQSFFVAHLKPPLRAGGGVEKAAVGGGDAGGSGVESNGAQSNGEEGGAAEIATQETGGAGEEFQYSPDPDEVTENELCDNRQSFLNACQANHFQFDQLRRAKHSSTMLCYNLHNPTAPIIDAAAGAAAAGAGPSPEGGETEERRAARQQSIQLHMRLLLHTSSCVSGQCASQNCRKMKGLLEHSKVCTARLNKQMCQVCRRVYALLHIHARDCRDDSCAVLHCKVFRERIRQMRRQQTQLDQRRRAAMNAGRANQAGGNQGPRALRE